MFKNIGNKIKIVAIILFILSAITCLSPLVYGIVVNSVRLMIFGGIAFVLGFVVSLIIAYLVYGYGVLIQSNCENAKTNKMILEYLKNNSVNAQPAEVEPVGQAPEIKAETIPEPAKQEAPTVEAPVAPVESPAFDLAAAQREFSSDPMIEVVPPSKPEAEFQPRAVVDDGSEVTVSIPRKNAPMAKRCGNCGNVVPPEALFCNQCGNKMN